MQVNVRDNQVEHALKILKKKIQKEGLFREIKMRKNYEKPTAKRVRLSAEYVRRMRKMQRKILERDGY